MYSLNGFGEMMLDKVRMDPYVHALRDAVRPDSVVFDIGTGTGIFAMLACQFGARRVVAIEPGDAIQVAREIAAANGLSDRIEFHQEMSTKIQPSEQADVIISDLRGVLPLLGEHIVSIADARKRLLAPGGVLIPQRDKLWVACVEAEDVYGRIEKPWSDQSFGIDMSIARKYLANQWFKAEIKPEQMLCDAVSIGELDYCTIEDPNFGGEATMTFARDGIAHGVSVWFDTILAKGIGYSNAPGNPYTVYGRAFFPWLKPVSVKAGDTATVRINANLVAGDYVWNWASRVFAQGDAGKIKADYRQSSFYGEVLLPQMLRKKAAEYVPSLNIDGMIDQKVLGMLVDGIVLGDIATELRTQFPEQFPKWQDAMARTGELSSRYSR